jgi:hypothetical protein
MRPQTLQERLMPCTQFEALERRWQAWCDRGIDSDKLTIQDKDKDKDDPQEVAVPLEAGIRDTTVDMFKWVLLFSQEAAEALYDDQMIMTLDVLQDLTDDIIKELCHAIRKPGGDGPGHQISKLSMRRLKLFAFWTRHMWWTSRVFDDWTNTTYDEIKILTNQKTLKDNLLDSKPPETPAMTLELHTAAKAFSDMLIILGKMQGTAGHPFSYVPHPSFKEPYNEDMDDKTEDPPAFWPAMEPQCLNRQQTLL